MPRRKQLTFHIQDLRCAGHIVEELSKLPQLDNFDMSSIELTIKENKPAPKIIKKDIDMLIDRLQRGFSANKHTVMQLNGYYLITNVHLAKWMRTTQASVNKWIKDGLIKPSKNSFTNLKSVKASPYRRAECGFYQLCRITGSRRPSYVHKSGL